MKDPVITPYGHCYDRESITEWLRNHQTDPLTNQPLSIEDLKPCFALKSAIEETIKSQKNAERTQL
jgi:STIP1 family protein 1